jgi:putative FmdB family regulatory protein
LQAIALARSTTNRERAASARTAFNLSRVLRAFNLTVPSRGNNVDGAMPIYEFRCAKCRTRFTLSMSISDHGRRRPVCPKCSGREVIAVLSPFFAKTVRKS